MKIGFDNEKYQSIQLMGYKLQVLAKISKVQAQLLTMGALPGSRLLLMRL